MRLIHTFKDPLAAEKFSQFLEKEGIENKLESVGNRDWGSPDYGDLLTHVWIIDEDQLDAALRYQEQFTNNPTDPLFNSAAKNTSMPKISFASPPSRKKIQDKGLGPITLYLLISCVLIFLYGEFTSPPIKAPLPPLPLTPLYSSPIEKMMMYDYPHAYDYIDKLAAAYGNDKLQNLEDVPAAGQVLLQQYQKTSYWQGYYDKFVAYFQGVENPWNIDAPLFEKIRAGEIWRIITPAFLHQNVFHLFFNMLWVLVLGKILEEKLGMVRFIIFILITAAVSNTAQYLMSGANFVGISGVICAMLGFIWARQQKAPWEGYILSPGVLSFMLFFIVAMVAIQTFSFFSEVYFKQTFVPGIANTAHVSGALIGYLLGRLKVFSLSR